MSETRVFISFAEVDRIACERVAACLRDAGADVWHSPTPREPSDRLPTDAERDAELRSRLLYVVLLSEAAYESPRIERECRAAVMLAREQPRRRIVPLVVHPTHYVGTWAFLDGFPRLHLYEIPAPLLAERILTPPNASQDVPPTDLPLEEDTADWSEIARRYRGLARAEARHRIPWRGPGQTTREMVSVLGRAQAKAVDRQHPVIEPEHLLFGMVSCPTAGALEVLAACGVRPQLIQARLHGTLPWSDHSLREHVQMSSRSKFVIIRAIFAGRAIRRPYFGTIQLLLGLLAEGGSAAVLLESHGLTSATARAIASRLLRPHLPW